MILDQDFHLFNVGEHSSYLCGKYAGELLSLVLQDDIQNRLLGSVAGPEQF